MQKGPRGGGGFRARRGDSPGIKSKLRGKLYHKGSVKKGNNAEQKVLLGIKDKNILSYLG